MSRTGEWTGYAVHSPFAYLFTRRLARTAINHASGVQTTGSPGLSPQDQQAYLDLAKWLAIAIPSLIGVVSAAALAIWKSYTDSRKQFDAQNAEHSKQQAAALQAQAAQTTTLNNELTPVLRSLSDTISQMAEDRQQIAVLKAAVDQREPLDSIIKQNGDLMGKATAALEHVSETLLAAMRDMRTAQTDIVAAVNGHTDTRVAALASTVGSIDATAQQNAQRLTDLTQKAVNHDAMTEKELKELALELEALPDRVAAQTKTAIQEALARLVALEAEVETLRPEKARADQLATLLAKRDRDLEVALAEVARLQALAPKTGEAQR